MIGETVYFFVEEAGGVVGRYLELSIGFPEGAIVE